MEDRPARTSSSSRSQGPQLRRDRRLRQNECLGRTKCQMMLNAIAFKHRRRPVIPVNGTGTTTARFGKSSLARSSLGIEIVRYDAELARRHIENGTAIDCHLQLIVNQRRKRRRRNRSVRTVLSHEKSDLAPLRKEDSARETGRGATFSCGAFSCPSFSIC
jgi:hypothetical protein